MQAVSFDDPICGDLAEPGRKRDDLLAEILVQPAVRRDEDFLNDIGSIDSRGEPAVEPFGNHPAQVIPVVPQKPQTRRLITATCLVNQLLGIRV